MGRYYNGDIEGKFWCGVQSSDDADFFGVEGTQPEELYYSFDERDLNNVNVGIESCKKVLGSYFSCLELFFKENMGYTTQDLAKYLNLSDTEVSNLLEWYARLILGLKIQKCIEENGGCDFTAEC